MTTPTPDTPDTPKHELENWSKDPDGNWHWVGPNDPVVPVTPAPTKNKSWVIWIVAIVAAALVAITAAVLFAGGESESGTSDSGTSTSSDIPEGDSIELASDVLDQVWNDMSYEDHELLCMGWNGGMGDMLVDEFMNGFEDGGSLTQYGISDAEVEQLFIDKLNEEC